MTYVKKSRTKLYLAIILIAILGISTAAVVYATLSAPKVEVGVKVGDTFTYSIKGTSHLLGENATETPGFSNYNNTDYYKITITAINGSSVSMDSNWHFLNGTEVKSTQTIDIGNGQKNDENGFWAVYPSNLNIGNKLRPKGYDETTVNNTDTYEYNSGVRGRCFWRINNQFYDVRDESRETLMYDYRDIFFDRETGMLTSFTNHQFYNNPEMELVIVWTLVDTSVWTV
jgi:hypothetical protein